MSDDFWARGILRRQPEQLDYAGLSYEQTSRKAQALCKAAAESGQTINCAAHLQALLHMGSNKS